MTQNQNNPYLLWAGEPARYVFQWNAGQGGVLPAQAYQARAPGSSSLGAADMLESGYGDSNFIPNPALRKVAPYRYCPPPAAPCGLRANAAAELNALGAARPEYGASVLAKIGASIVDGVSSVFGGGKASATTSTVMPQPTAQRMAPSSMRTTLGPRGRGSLGDWPQVRPQGFEPGWMATGSIPVWDNLSSNQKMLAFVALGAGALWWLSRHPGGLLGDFLSRRPRRRRNPWAVTARHARGVTGTVRFKSKKFAHSYADDLRKSKKHSRVRVSRY